MYHTIDEFIADWTEETKGTQKILDALTDVSLKQGGLPDDRTLGKLGWHIALCISEMMGQTGLMIESPKRDTPIPTSAKKISSTYKTASENFIKELKNKWTNETLNKEFDMFGFKWTGIMTLNSLIRHEIHHRAQMTILMRQAGLRVPGVYGPSKEEWAEMGMPTQ